MCGNVKLTYYNWLMVEPPTPLKNDGLYDFVSWDDDIPNIWENKIHVPNMSKPPTR